MRLDESLERRIKLRGLHILEATIAAGSMAGAARTLAMSQPAVSYAIAEMEQALGVPLLDRTPHGVLPTVYGQALARRGVAVFNELRQGVNDIAFLADPRAGELRIGATPPMSAVAAAAIERLTGLHPRMRFHVLVEPTDILLRELNQRSIELVISRMADAAAPEGVSAEILFHDRLAVIAGKRNRWARRRRPLVLAELMDGPWALPSADSFLGQMIGEAFTAGGLEPPRATVATRSTYTLATLASGGRFLIIHPETMLRVPSQHRLLTALPVELPKASHPIALLKLRDRAPSPVAGLFAQAIRDVVQGAGLGPPTPATRRAAAPRSWPGAGGSAQC